MRNRYGSPGPADFRPGISRNICDNCPSRLSWLALNASISRIQISTSVHKIDITNPEEMRRLVRSHPPDRVFHLAGAMPPAEEAELWRVNVGGTQILLQSLAAAGEASSRSNDRLRRRVLPAPTQPA